MKYRFLCVLLLLMSLLVCACTKQQESTTLENPDHDRMNLTIQVDEEERLLTIRQGIKLRNHTGQTQSALCLRAYANAYMSSETSPCGDSEMLGADCYPEGFSIGWLKVSAACELNQQGEPTAGIDYRYTDENRQTLLLPLSAPWQPGEEVSVEIQYTVYVPKAAWRFGIQEDLWCLGDAVLVPSVWEEDAWRTDTLQPLGEPMRGDCADWNVEIIAPAEFQLISCAKIQQREQTTDGKIRWRTAGENLRGFAFALGKNIIRKEQSAEGVSISVYAREEAAARRILSAARDALQVYARLLGSCPFESLSLCAGQFSRSFSESGLILLPEDADRYEVARVVARQWWAAPWAAMA